MPVENELTIQPIPSAPGPDAPPAIRVKDLHKSFRIPTQRVDSLKERAVHPFATREHRELHALNGISFEIRQGEFFGIVGRNGSGKSTLLKLLASIYRADSGSIEIAGRLAPFIELGVGFNHDLTARENVVLNGVMMGLTPREMRRRLDAVIDFAELREFADLKLKNYSSGMMVRLAFSVMMEADADVLLIDEVLAVGDASFQQKCADAFHQMKAEGKTIVLVTHEMGAVDAYCHRAMLLSDGDIKHAGDPAEVSREYLKLNFASELNSELEKTIPAEENEPGEGADLAGLRIVDEEGEETQTVEMGDPIHLEAEIELLRPVPGLHVGLVVANADDVSMFELSVPIRSKDGDNIKGRKVTVSATIQNPLSPGRHFIHCGIQSPFGVSVFRSKAATFVVFGTHPSKGIIAPEHEYEYVIEGEDDL
ncbi:MAG: ABC transporter ATP-binding protein [Actinobacteria bacterium]|nr:ABC transporter ATP-binding protein [Actinomycetota bacterium]